MLNVFHAFTLHHHRHHPRGDIKSLSHRFEHISTVYPVKSNESLLANLCHVFFLSDSEIPDLRISVIINITFLFIRCKR